jgi:antitoxin component YwqK of YwqJK toxin-antitoxin module
MKKLLFLLIITTSFCYSQEGKLSVFLDFDKLPIGEKITIYYNNEWRPLVKKDSASFYREITFKEKKIPAGRIIDYYINGVKQNMFYASYVGLDKQGIDSVFTQGPSTRYYENSNKSSSSSYLNNNKIGEENNYNEFGKLVATNNFEDGILQGEQIFYYESGEVETKRTWVNGLLQGEEIVYYKSGEIEITTNYIDGLVDGELKLFSKNGNLLMRKKYLKGKLNGEVISFRDDGSKLAINYYEKNRREGENIGFYPSGKVKWTRTFKDDLLQGEGRHYYETGEVESKYSYINDLLQGEDTGYYKSGQVEYKINYVDNLKQGELIYYYESGEIEFKSNYVDDLRQGEQIYYKTGQTKDTISGLYIEGKIDYTKLWLNGKIKERRIALVIGNANYNKGILENPVNDATLIAESLKKLDFEVLLHTNLATEDAMLDAIKDFGRKRKNYEIGFVYYAGHGVQLNNQNYLLPTKEVFEYEEDVEDNAVSMQRVLRYLEASREGQLNFVVLDACRDNPFESNWNKTRSLKGGGLAKTPPPQGSLIAYSTDHGQTAADGNGENSMYSKALASNLLVKGISIEQVFKNVRTEVLKLSKNKQSPVEESKLTGEVFYMNKKEEK